jgi:hypothetical protein
MIRFTVALAGALFATASLAQSAPSPHGAPHSATAAGTSMGAPHPATAASMPMGAPHSTTAAGTSMGALTPSTATRQMLTCRIDQLGNVPVLVNFADRTALSTRAPGISPATIEGDVVRWQEKEAGGGTSKYTLNRKSGEIQVALPGPGGKDVVRRGTCAPPVAHR